jgi:hypothetical protein
MDELKMEEFVIEKNIPVPAYNPAKRRKYPFMYLEVGDSFFVEANGDKFKKIEATIRSSSGHYHKMSGRKFAVKRVDGGLRCWRLK